MSVWNFGDTIQHQDIFRFDVSMNDIFIMVINQSLGDSFEDFSEWVTGNFSNLTGQASIWTVVQNDYQVLFLVKKEKLSGFQDILMVQGNVELGLLFGEFFSIFVDWNQF